MNRLICETARSFSEWSRRTPFMSTMAKFEGYHDPATLPIKAGDTVTILKGTLIETVGKPVRIAGKTYKVKVHHVLCGMTAPQHAGVVVKYPPAVRWAGPGGYWSEADINDIPEAQ